MMTRKTILALGLALAACSEGSELRSLQPLLVLELGVDPNGGADHLVDFGQVPVGNRSTVGISVTNRGAVALILRGGAPAEPFSIGTSSVQLRLEAGESAELQLSFAPILPSGDPVEQRWELTTNEEGSRSSRSIRLVGRGVIPRLACTPAILDFGQVVRGTQVSLPLRCSNALDTDVAVSTAIFRGTFVDAYSVAEFPSQGLLISAGGEVELPISFAARTPGRSDGLLLLRDAKNQLLASLELRAETSESALVLEPEGCVDFGYVREGSSAARSLTIHNQGTVEVAILGARILGEGEPPFTIVGSFPSRLAAGGAAAMELEVGFHPEAPGKYRAQLELLTSDPGGGATSVTACLNGMGGGPALSCSPEVIHFGEAAVGVPVRRQLRCSNDGSTAPGFSVDPLLIEGLSFDEPSFTAAIIDEAGEEIGPDPFGYEAGDSFLVAIDFRPSEEGFSGGALRFDSNDPAAKQVLASGEGILLPPCAYSLLPLSLDFGTVERGLSSSRNFTVVNNINTPCVVSDLHLTKDSDPAFSLEPIDHLVLEGGARLEVPVRFAPAHYQAGFSGRVVFQISNPDAPLIQIPLEGRSAFPCLSIDPSPVDFGRMGVDCHGSDRTITISNVCGAPLRLDSLELDDSADAESFAIRSRPEGMPLTLMPGERTDFTMRIRPGRLGALNAMVVAEAEENSGAHLRFLSPLQGLGASDLEQRDRFVQPSRTKIDLLFVIETAGADIGPYQAELRKRIPGLIEVGLTEDIDFQIAVTTTGVVQAGSCGPPAYGREGGRFVPINADVSTPPLPRILSRSTPDLVSALQLNLTLSTCHSLSTPYEAVFQALSPPLSQEERDSRANKTGDADWRDGNAGFLRADASLAVVFLSLRADASTQFDRTVEQYISSILAVKEARMRPLSRFFAITTPPSGDAAPSCGTYQYRGDRLLQGVDATGGSWFDICTPIANQEAWDAGLADLWSEVFHQVSAFPLQTRPAGSGEQGEILPADLEVTVNGNPIADRDQGFPVWSYDPLKNAVEFDRLSAPPPGSEIGVRYQVACLDD